jgi:NAD+ synthase
MTQTSSERPASTGFRLAMAQVNPTVGDIEGNTNRVRAARARAAADGADLVAFP